MKMKPEHLAILRAAVAPHDTIGHRAAYRAGNFPNADACKDKNMRYRWDCVYRSKLRIVARAAMPDDLVVYDYLNDDNIDTALRSFIAPLE